MAQAGYLLAAFGVATIPSRLLGGRLSDRWGTRTTIVAGLVGDRGRAAAGRWVAIADPGRGRGGAARAGVRGLRATEPVARGRRHVAGGPPVAFGLLAAAWPRRAWAPGCCSGAGGDRPAVAVRGRRGDLPGVRGGRVVAASRSRDSRPSSRRSVRLGRGVTAGCSCCSGSARGFAVVYLQVTITLPLTVTARGLSSSVVGLLLTVSAATVVLAQPLLALPGGCAASTTRRRWRSGHRRARGRAGADRARDRPGGLRPRDRRVEPRRRAPDGSRLHPRLGDRPGARPAAPTSRRTAPAGASPRSSPRSSAPSCSAGSDPRRPGRRWPVCASRSPRRTFARVDPSAAGYLEALTAGRRRARRATRRRLPARLAACSAGACRRAATSTSSSWSTAR